MGEAVQRCKSERSSCAKVRDRSIEYGVSSIGRGWNLYAQRGTGGRMIGGGHSFRVSGLGSREPGSGVQVRVQVQDLNIARTRTCT